MQSQGNRGRGLDLSDSRNVQMFLRLPCHHALQQPVHVAHGRSQYIDSGGFNVLFRLYRRSQTARHLSNVFVYLRAGSDVPDLSLDENSRMDSLESSHRLFGLSHVLLERQGGTIEDHCVEASFGCFNRALQRVRMIRVEEDRKIKLLPQALNQ